MSPRACGWPTCDGMCQSAYMYTHTYIEQGVDSQSDDTTQRSPMNPTNCLPDPRFMDEGIDQSVSRQRLCISLSLFSSLLAPHGGDGDGPSTDFTYDVTYTSKEREQGEVAYDAMCMSLVVHIVILCMRSPPEYEWFPWLLAFSLFGEEPKYSTSRYTPLRIDYGGGGGGGGSREREACTVQYVETKQPQPMSRQGQLPRLVSLDVIGYHCCSH